MAIECIKEYRQTNGEDILKVILKPTQNFPDGAYFYADACDEELVRRYTWSLKSQKHPYIVVGNQGRLYCASCNEELIEQHSRHTQRQPCIKINGQDYYMDTKALRFHREKAHNILNYYPDYINHIDGIEYDNVNMNLDKVTNQQNRWCVPSKGYSIDGRSFQPRIKVNPQNIYAKRVRTEVEAIQSAYRLEVTYEDYRYDFLKDRRKDIDILDLERTGQISEDEAVYRHVLRYAADNAWYVYRYNLFEYYKDNNIPIPMYAIDDEGFMTHHITGQRLCPL